jgi:predicted metal-dependent phosphoesterase TrpH
MAIRSLPRSLASRRDRGHNRRVSAYRIELHCHCQGDPVDTYLRHTVFETIDQAVKVGLHALAITWHRKIFDRPEAIDYARERGLLLIPGIEAEIGNRHLVVLNLAPGDLPDDPTWDEVRALRARKPEVVTMAPHPFYPHPTCLGRAMEPHRDCIDLVEWCKLHVHWLPGGINPNLRAEHWARRHGKTMVACSDAHKLEQIGRNASTVEAEALTVPAVFEALRAGRVTFHRHSLRLGALVYETSKAIGSQPRHLVRSARLRLSGRSAARSRLQSTPPVLS